MVTTPRSVTRALAAGLVAAGAACAVVSTAASAQPSPAGNAGRLDAAVADSFARAARAMPRPASPPFPCPTAPVIDGRLDEAMWREGEAVSAFVQRELDEGVPASERTEVRFCHRRRQPLHRCPALRPRAAAHRAGREDPRRHAHQQRLRRHHPRHVPRPAERLRLRDHAGRHRVRRPGDPRRRRGRLEQAGRRIACRPARWAAST